MGLRFAIRVVAFSRRIDTCQHRSADVCISAPLVGSLPESRMAATFAPQPKKCPPNAHAAGGLRCRPRDGQPARPCPQSHASAPTHPNAGLLAHALVCARSSSAGEISAGSRIPNRTSEDTPGARPAPSPSQVRRSPLRSQGPYGPGSAGETGAGSDRGPPARTPGEFRRFARAAVFEAHSTNSEGNRRRVRRELPALPRRELSSTRWRRHGNLPGAPRWGPFYLTSTTTACACRRPWTWLLWRVTLCGTSAQSAFVPVRPPALPMRVPHHVAAADAALMSHRARRTMLHFGEAIRFHLVLVRLDMVS